MAAGEGTSAAQKNPPDSHNRLAKYVVEDYEPKFDREGFERRVLGHITDEDHVGRGPRNTVERLRQEIDEDMHTTQGSGADVQGALNRLQDEGLVRKSGGAYHVTKAGLTELVN